MGRPFASEPDSKAGIVNKLLKGDVFVDTKTGIVAMEVVNPIPVMGKVLVLNQGSDTERRVSVEDLRQRISDDELRLLRSPAVSIGLAVGPKDYTTRNRRSRSRPSYEKVESAHSRSLAIATRAVRIANDYCQSFGTSLHAGYCGIKEEFERVSPGLKFPSPAQLYRYMERHQKGLPLVAPPTCKGNRSPRYSADTVRLICTAMTPLVMKAKSRWSLKQLTEQCNLTVRAASLLDKTSSLSRKFVSKQILTELTANPDIVHLLPKERGVKASVSTGRIRAGGILQRVEQDALHLPIAVQTEDGIRTDVWLVHAIDCGTSNVVGWHLTLGAPNASDGLLCVESTLYSKKARYRRLGITPVHDIFGTPLALFFDNGPEAKGERMQRLTSLGVDCFYLPGYQPAKKPFIERLNKSLKEDLELLEGSTRTGGVDGTRDPVAMGDQLPTLEKLEYWIARWYQHEWAEKPLMRFVDEEVFEDIELGITPHERYRKMVERDGYPMTMPPSRDQWMRLKFYFVTRQLNRNTGISYAGFSFQGPNIVQLLDKFGEKRISLLADPADFRRIYALDGDDMVELVNSVVGPTTPAYSFTVARERRKQGRLRHVDSPEREKFREDLHAEGVKSSKEKPKSLPKKAKQQQQRAVAEEREAIERAALNPVPASKTGPYSDSVATDYGDVELLAPINRKTGASL